MNTMLLKSVMTLHGDNIKTLAEYLGKTPQMISRKINEDNAEFRQGEIALIKERYNLTAEQVEEIFFSQ